MLFLKNITLWFSSLKKAIVDFHFHQWEDYTDSEYASGTDEYLGVIKTPATRTCKICGKKQVQDVHCLGLNPPSYTTSWLWKT